MAFLSPSYRLLAKKILLGAFLIISTLMSTYYIIYFGPGAGMMVAAAIVAFGIGAYSIVNYEFGFYSGIALGFFIFFLDRLMDEVFPVGLIVDVQILVTFGGLIVHKVIKREPLFKGAKHIITYAYMVYTLYLLLQFFNPNMYSIDGWVLIVRKFLQFLMIYLIAINIFSSIEKVRFFFRFIVLMAAIAGAYGCYQEWFGLMDFEEAWIWADPKRAGLYFLYDGSFRKFSSLSDPAAFGITMAAAGLLTLVLAIGATSRTRTILLLIGASFMLLGVAYSGTRTSYFILTVGILLYVLMTLSNRNTLIFASFFAMGFVVIVWGPIYGNTTINRIRSTFEFSKDGSLEVRDVNRKAIQPYIYDHPIGGGLATSGAQGMQYNPGHPLAGFPPDSGFVKVAIETGWIGFTFQIILYFLILRTAVHEYYVAHSRKIKSYYLAVIVCVFSFVVAQYSQEAIAQIPGFFIFYSSIALIVRLKHFDTPKTSDTHNTTPA